MQSRPRAALGFILHLARVVFCLLTDFIIGIFQTICEHIVISSWLGTDYSFLAPGVFCRSISSRTGDHRGRFVFKRFFLDKMHRITPSFWGRGRCTVKGSNRSNMVSSPSFSRSKFPQTDKNSMDGAAFLFRGSHHRGEVFDAAFDHCLTLQESGSFS